jgi:hypothetical protein
MLILKIRTNLGMNDRTQHVGKDDSKEVFFRTS